MTIGIIVAMTKELNLLLPLMDNRETRKAGGTEFHIGNIGTNRVALMECGIGKVNAAIGAITLIDTFHPRPRNQHRRGSRSRRECSRNGRRCRDRSRSSRFLVHRRGVGTSARMSAYISRTHICRSCRCSQRETRTHSLGRTLHHLGRTGRRHQEKLSRRHGH